MGAALLARELIGRDGELAELEGALDAAVGGAGSLWFVAGEPGVGKSRLVRSVVEMAEARAVRTLQGRAVSSSAPVAYRALVEALGAAVRTGLIDPTTPDLQPVRRALAHVIVDLHDGEDEVAASALAVGEGVRRAVVAAGGGAATLLVLEDLHWADPDTLAVVEYLADNLHDEPVLCVVTVRDSEPSAARDLLGTLHDRRAARTLRLSRLAGAEVERMVASCLQVEPDAPELADLTARADGLPFLVEELLAAAAHAGALVRANDGWTFVGSPDRVVPLTFADSVRRRLADLGSGRAVVAAAALLGRRFDWRLLPGATHLSEEDVAAALQAAAELQLISAEDSGQLAFRHALTRDAVLVELLPPERASLARAALAAVERAHPGLAGDWCELAADLAEQAGERGRAGELLHLAGARALEAGALGSAELVLARARSLVTGDDLADVEEQLTAVLAHAGKPDDATEVGEALLARLDATGSTARRRARVQLDLARAALASGRLDVAADRLARAEDAASSLDDPVLRARVDVVAAQVAVLRAPRDAMTRASAALAAAEAADLPEVACEALEVVGRLHRGSDLAQAEAAFEKAHDLAARLGREGWRMRALHELGTIDLLRCGDVARLEQARELAQQLGAVATAAVVDVQIGATLTGADDPEPGLGPCRRAEQLARRHRLAQTLAAALVFQAVAHARAGRAGEWERCLEEATEVGGGLPEVTYNVAWARAQLALVRDDRAEAIAVLNAAIRRDDDPVGVEASGPWAGTLALLTAVEGDHHTASHLLARPQVHFIGTGHAHYARAVLAGRDGDGETAAREVAAGDARFGAFGWYRHLGRRHLAEAALADGWGDPSSWLLDALAHFDTATDQRLATACRSLLRQAGLPVPRRRSAPADRPELQRLGITAREAEVLDLLGHGLSNQAIGAELHLSPRTVERHVANLTDKTGVTRRSELVAFAARHDERAPSA